MMLYLVVVIFVLQVAIIFWLVRRRNKKLEALLARQAQVPLARYLPRPNPSPGMIAGSGRPAVGLTKPNRVVREGSSGYAYPDAFASQPHFFADPVSTVQYDDDTRRSSMFDGGSSGGAGASSSWDSGSSDSGGSCDSGGGDSGGGGCD